MAMFRYEGMTVTGEKVQGNIHATIESDVYNQLRKKKIKAKVILRREENLATKEIKLFDRVPLKQLSFYLQQMSTLINAGISVLDASTMLENQVKEKLFHKVLTEVRKDLENGEQLSACYKKHPNAFPGLLVNVIAVAEMSGSLEINLQQIAGYYEKRLVNRSSLITAMVYPILMLVASVGVAIFLMVSIVPMFIQMFESFDAPLPPITIVTIAISDFLKNQYILIIGIVLECVIGSFSIKYHPGLAFKADTYKLKLPFVGELIQKNDFSVFLMTLSTLLSSSVPMVQALKMSKESVSNLYIKEVIAKCELEIAQGGKLSQVFLASHVTPPILSQMVQIGERTGALDSMLSKLSIIFEREVDEVSKRVKTVMEPLVMVIIAVIVGFIVAAIMLPMLSVYTSIQG